jgi:hypothetical protein
MQGFILFDDFVCNIPRENHHEIGRFGRERMSFDVRRDA